MGIRVGNLSEMKNVLFYRGLIKCKSDDVWIDEIYEIWFF